MKINFIAVLFLMPALAWAGSSKPSGPTVTIHVQASQLVTLCEPQCYRSQHLTVIIDGKKYELDPDKSITLRADTSLGVLRVGDYQATIVSDEQQGTYEYHRKYRITFPDGKTRDYLVVGEFE